MYVICRQSDYIFIYYREIIYLLNIRKRATEGTNLFVKLCQNVVEFPHHLRVDGVT